VVATTSATPQLKKLGIAAGSRWAIVDADEGWAFEIPPDAAGRVDGGEAADVVVAFVRTAIEIPPLIVRLEASILPAGALWIAWPRRAAGHLSDVTDTVVRDAALERKLVDVKVAAIDADWSALKLVWRREHRGD
jgi:hypothetical protein